MTGSTLRSCPGRQLNLSAALLALSVLTDSGVEHYRGSFQNRAMYTPLAAATLALGASLFGILDPRLKRHEARDAIYALSALSGLAGFGFHLYNIRKRPGGWSWLNLFYGAPVGAPFALVLAGLLGRGAEKVREQLPNPRHLPLADPPAPSLAAGTGKPVTPSILGAPADRVLAAVSAVGLLGTVAEAALLHFRGAYHNPAMTLPVSVPPVAATLLGVAAWAPRRGSSRLAGWWLKLTALLGFAGVGFHAYGISRNMGGWRNWSQNLLNGPPLPAPPSFTALAISGLAALSLMNERLTQGLGDARRPH